MKQNPCTLSYDANPKQEDIDLLSQGLADYARQKRGLPPIKYFAFWVKDVNKYIQGGCNGIIYYGCLYIDQIWLSEFFRHHGYGTQLLEACEKLAKEKNCFCVTINTMDWEALDFYKKLGHQLEFKRDGYLKNSILYCLRKNIS